MADFRRELSQASPVGTEAVQTKVADGGIAKGIAGTTQAVDNFLQASEREETKAVFDQIVQAATPIREEVLAPLADPAKDSIDNSVKGLESAQKGVKQGRSNLTEQGLQMRVVSEASRLMAQHPDRADYIRQKFSAFTGVDPMRAADELAFGQARTQAAIEESVIKKFARPEELYKYGNDREGLMSAISERTGYEQKVAEGLMRAQEALGKDTKLTNMEQVQSLEKAHSDWYEANWDSVNTLMKRYTQTHYADVDTRTQIQNEMEMLIEGSIQNVTAGISNPLVIEEFRKRIDADLSGMRELMNLPEGFDMLTAMATETEKLNKVIANKQELERTTYGIVQVDGGSNGLMSNIFMGGLKFMRGQQKAVEEYSNALEARRTDPRGFLKAQLDFNPLATPQDKAAQIGKKAVSAALGETTMGDLKKTMAEEEYVAVAGAIVEGLAKTVNDGKTDETTIRNFEGSLNSMYESLALEPDNYGAVDDAYKRVVGKSGYWEKVGAMPADKAAAHRLSAINITAEHLANLAAGRLVSNKGTLKDFTNISITDEFLFAIDTAVRGAPAELNQPDRVAAVREMNAVLGNLPDKAAREAVMKTMLNGGRGFEVPTKFTYTGGKLPKGSVDNRVTQFTEGVASAPGDFARGVGGSGSAFMNGLGMAFSALPDTLQRAFKNNNFEQKGPSGSIDIREEGKVGTYEPDLNRLAEQLKVDEGVKNKIYKDSEGHLTVGIGHKIVEGDPEYGQPEGTRVSDERVMELFEQDLELHKEETKRVFPQLETYPSAVQEALINMTFNLGATRLAGFKKMKAALDVGNWEEAAAQALDSKWAKQVGRRADRIATLLREGEGRG